MVIVEFFSKSPIDNMISTLVSRPETLVFVGDRKLMLQSDPVFRRFLAATGNTATQIVYRGVKSRDFWEIVDTLDQIAQEYPGCHFDITGGEPMILAAMGVIFERYRHRGIELHQYNVRTGKVYDCDRNGIPAPGACPLLSVEQNILLHGGSVLPDGPRMPWPPEESFLPDLRALWEICKSNCSRWNSRISMLGGLCSHSPESPDPLLFHADLSADRNGQASLLLRQLKKAGLISEISRDGNRLCLRYKNALVRQCLEKAGTVLELYTWASALSLRDRKGRPVYHDGQPSVSIDWDGIRHSKGNPETRNEIDVVLMHGVLPVFLSCKNGSVGEDELYKLNTVAERFGGRYVKKVLVATTLGKRTAKSRQYFLERAKDMEITVLEGVHRLTEEDFQKQLSALV